MTTPAQAGHGAVPGVDPDRAAALVDEGASLLDVREPDEWAAGHVPGAIHIPMGEVIDRVDRISGAGRVVVVCRSGGRSARVAEYLLGIGVDAVNLEGGMQAWSARGLPMQSAGGVPPTVA